MLFYVQLKVLAVLYMSFCISNKILMFIGILCVESAKVHSISNTFTPDSGSAFKAMVVTVFQFMWILSCG